MELDLVSQWTLWFFGACFAGMAVGFVVGKLLSFEAGLGVGLLLAGFVSLSYVPRFWIEYGDFESHPLRAAGTVVAIEDRAVNEAGDVTTPVAVIEYEAPDGEKRRAESKGGSSLDVGDEVVVVPQPGGAKVGQPSEMQGGAIAALLFGTFPFSAGLFYVASAIVGRREAKLDAAARRRAAERTARPSRVTPIANLATFAGFVGPIVWAGLTDPPVLRALLLAFGLTSVGLWMHVVDGFRMRRDPRWSLGIAVIALNFSVWAAALWSFGAADASW